MIHSFSNNWRSMAVAAMVFPFLVANTRAADAPKPILLDHISTPELRDKTPRLWAATFSPDGKTLAVTAGWDHPEEPGELVLWNVASRLPKLILRQDETVRCVAFTRDGGRIAIGDFKGLTRVLDPETGAVILALPKQEKLVNAVAFSPKDGRLVTGGFSETVQFWNVQNGNLDHTFQLPGEGITSLTFSPDGIRLAATTWPGKVHVWDLGRMTELFVVMANDHDSIAEVASFSPDGRTLAIGSWDQTLRLISTSDGTTVREFTGHKAPVHNAIFSPQGGVLASSDAAGTIHLWDPMTGQTKSTWRAHRDRCFGLSFSPDGQILATAGWDRQIHLWDTTTLKQAGSFQRTSE
jgi:WD40 repeat protein